MENEYKKGIRTVQFKREGVTFTIPSYLDEVSVKRLDKPKKWPKSDKYQEKKFVINFTFVYEKIDNKAPVIKPDEPITMKVHFSDKHLPTDDDASENQAHKKLQLGFYEELKWEDVDKAPTKHTVTDKQKYDEKINSWVGHWEVSFLKLKDPLIGWGP